MNLEQFFPDLDQLLMQIVLCRNVLSTGAAERNLRRRQCGAMILPCGVNGTASSGTYTDGTMYSGRRTYQVG